MLTQERCEAYIRILEEELHTATGCTEPIAIAYCAAKLRALLGKQPERILAEVSGNILKNVKSVVVPNTGGQKGIRAAIRAGIVADRAERELEVIASITQEEQREIASYEERTSIEIQCPDTPRMLDIRLTSFAGTDQAVVHIANHHTNVIYEALNGEVRLEKPLSDSPEDNLTDKSVLNVKDIVSFADTVDLSQVSQLLQRQITCNEAIAQEGLRGDWGAGIGKLLLAGGDGIRAEARAYAAAGSDARMSGCEMPVVIVSGSGNQGMAASLPVIRYARHLGVSQEKMYRALLVSDLVTIHQKTGIGRLSAYCGAVSAGVGAGAGIAYLTDGSYHAVAHTIVNAVAILSGMICDGAKPSCAAKIAAAVDAGILGYQMVSGKTQFRDGDGIVHKGVENTIANVGVLARVGMAATDRTILALMMGGRPPSGVSSGSQPGQERHDNQRLNDKF